MVLGDADRLAAGNTQLLGNQVDAGHHLGDGMLHLDAGVHLHEVEAAAAIHQELNRASALVVDRAGRRDGGFAHAAAQFGVDGGAWRFLEQLLVAALDGAVPFAQVHHMAVAIGQHLHLHVARPVDEFLHVEAGVAKGRLGLALGGLEQVVELVAGGHQAHAPAAAAGGGLDHHRVAHGLGQGGGFGGVFEQALAAGNGGDPHPLHRGLGGGLIAHGPDRLGRGAHKGDAVGGANFGEAVVFGQEAVARVDRIGAARGCGGNDVGNIEIALAAGRFAHAHGLIGQLHVQGVAIHRAVNGHGGDPQLAAGAQDAQGDFAPVGDQQLADGHSVAVRRNPATQAAADCISAHLAPHQGLGRSMGILLAGGASALIQPRGCGGIGRHARLRGV